MEVLFSLEVVVNYLKINSLRPKSTTCLMPTVAFRLLDFPTIAISLMEKFDVDQLKSRLDLKKPFELIESLPCFTELLDKYGRFVFAKGKSCLFKSNIDLLRAYLKNTPLYLMILDTFFEPYKLIGTVLVPLNNLINEIHQELSVGERTDDQLCMKMSHGVLDVKNLMGEDVGHISVVVRLTSFGKNILPHLINKRGKVDNELTRLASEHEKKKEILQTISVNEHEVYEVKKKTAQNSTNTELELNNDALTQTIPIDYKDAQIQINDIPNNNKRDKSTQSPSRFPKSNKSIGENEQSSKVYLIRNNSEQAFFDQYNPPPLYFNSQNSVLEKTMPEKILNGFKEKNNFLNDRMSYLNDALENEEFIEADSDEKLLIEQNDEEEQPREIIIHKVDKNKANNQLNFEQVPLLNCLFEEISKLKVLMENNSHSQSIITKNPVQSIKSNNMISTQKRKNIKQMNQPKSVLKNVKSNRETIKQSVERLSRPKEFIQVKQEPIVKVKRTEIEKKVNNKPKEPLKYGLTNTFKMRALINKQERVKTIETIHNTLLEEVKKNLDDLNLSSANASNDQLTEIIQKNLEKLLVDSMGSGNQTNESSTMKQTDKFTNADKNPSEFLNTNINNKSTTNLTLLNRVDMESTIDTMNYQNLLNNAMNMQTPTKVVQFGNTYVYDSGSTSSPSSAQKTTVKEDDHLDDEDNYSSSRKINNIFLKNKNKQNYDDDFHSSLDSSSMTNSKQFENGNRKSPRPASRRSDFFDFENNSQNNYSYNSQSFTHDSTNSTK